MIHQSCAIRQSRRHALSAVFLTLAAWVPACTQVSGDAPPRQKNGPIATTARPRSAPSHVRFHVEPKPLAAGAVTSDWTSLLGPARNGVCRETKLLKEWPEQGPVLVWEMATGSGYASPAVAGNSLVFFHRVGDEERVECLDALTGQCRWSYAYPSSYEDRYKFGNGPRSSPVIDDGRVYTHGAQGALHGFDLETGRLIWKRQTSTEFKVPQDFFGVVSTPLVEGDVLIVNVGAPGGPCVVAFDKRTGKTVWTAGDRWGPSDASLVAADVHGRRRIFVFAGGDSDPPTGGLLALDPGNGTIDLRFPFRSKTYTSINAANPVVVGSRVFVTSAYRTGGALLNVLPDGGYEPVWKTDALRAHFVTPVHKGGYLYGFDGSGGQTSLVCADLKTGQRVWKATPQWPERVRVNGKQQTRTYFLQPGALILADGHFLCLSEMGHLLWLDLTPKGYKELRRTSLFTARETWTPPVISRGLLYVTQNKRDTIHNTPPRLLCYDFRAAR